MIKAEVATCEVHISREICPDGYAAMGFIHAAIKAEAERRGIKVGYFSVAPGDNKDYTLCSPSELRQQRGGS